MSANNPNQMRSQNEENETHNSSGRVGGDGELLVAVVVPVQKIYTKKRPNKTTSKPINYTAKKNPKRIR